MIPTLIVDFNGEALTIIDGEKRRHSSKTSAENLASLKKVSFGIIFDHRSLEESKNRFKEILK